MINKLDSKDMVEILDKAQNSHKQLEADINIIKNDLSKKLVVIKNEQEYANKEIIDFKEMLINNDISNSKNRIVFAAAKNLSGEYDMFGTTIHPKFAKTPNNIFNFFTETNVIYKNNANVLINEEPNDNYKSILMHDNIIDKGICFAEYDNPNIKIEIEINLSDLLGSTSFNTIEIMPFLPGSFTINEIQIFEINSEKTLSTIPSHTISNIENVGVSRIFLNQKYNMHKCIFDITINYQNTSGKYPFGLKHLYFLNADFITESYVISKIEKNDYINTVSEKIYIHDQTSTYETTCTQKNIEIFMGYLNGILEYKIYTSSGTNVNMIARNTREIYVKIPIEKGIISLEFDEINTN